MFDFINSDDQHYFCDYLLRNRSEKSKSQNKIGPYKSDISSKSLSQSTFLYKSVNVYSKLPKNITLSKNKKMFKSWQKKYTLDNNIKIPTREDNSKIYTYHQVNLQNIASCEQSIQNG